jgi:hypothetical protein
MSTTVPTYTGNTAGNVRASSSLGAAGTANYDVDYSAKFEGQIHIKNTPGTTAATRGLKVEFFRNYGSAPTKGQTAFYTVTLPSLTNGVAESQDVFLGPGKYNITITNLDTSNAVTVEITGDTVSSTTTT